MAIGANLFHDGVTLALDIFSGKVRAASIVRSDSPGYDSYVILKKLIPGDLGWAEAVEQMGSVQSFKFLSLVVLAVLVLAACGASDFEGRDGVPLKGLEVTRAEYSDIWPFDAKGGTPECVGSSAAVFHHGGDSYALNQPALDQAYTPVSSVRKKGGKLTREHYDLAVESGDISPNIRSYDQFKDSFKTADIYYKEFPKLVDRIRGDLGPMTELALTLC